MTMTPIRPSKLTNELASNAAANIPTMIWGPPGVGKSQVVYQYATSIGAKLFELRANLFDPVDVRGGLKVVEQSDGSYRTKYGVPEDYPDTNYQGPVVLFIDELPNAPKATQNALLQLILDKKIGTYNLPPQTVIIAAGNRSADRASVSEMPTPVKNRFAHYEIEANIDDWVHWALKTGVNSTLIGYLRYRPQYLHEMDVKENAFPSPRSWDMLNRKLATMSNDKESQVVGAAAVIGNAHAGDFIAYRDVETQMPDIDNIIKHPTQASVPTETSVIWAVCGALASRADKNTFAAIVKYAQRMPPEYQVVTLKDSIAKDKTLGRDPAFLSWAQTNASVFL